MAYSSRQVTFCIVSLLFVFGGLAISEGCQYNNISSTFWVYRGQCLTNCTKVNDNEFCLKSNDCPRTLKEYEDVCNITEKCQLDLKTCEDDDNIHTGLSKNDTSNQDIFLNNFLFANDTFLIMEWFDLPMGVMVYQIDKSSPQVVFGPNISLLVSANEKIPHISLSYTEHCRTPTYFDICDLIKVRAKDYIFIYRSNHTLQTEIYTDFQLLIEYFTVRPKCLGSEYRFLEESTSNSDFITEHALDPNDRICSLQNIILYVKGNICEPIHYDERELSYMTIQIHTHRTQIPFCIVTPNDTVLHQLDNSMHINWTSCRESDRQSLLVYFHWGYLDQRSFDNYFKDGGRFTILKPDVTSYILDDLEFGVTYAVQIFYIFDNTYLDTINEVFHSLLLSSKFNLIKPIATQASTIDGDKPLISLNFQLVGICVVLVIVLQVVCFLGVMYYRRHTQRKVQRNTPVQNEKSVQNVYIDLPLKNNPRVSWDD